MDFSWTHAQQELYDRVFQAAREQLSSAARGQNPPPDWGRREWQMCGELGVLGLSVDEQYGGLGLDALTTAHTAEAFGRGCDDMGLVFAASAHLYACVMPIFEYGSAQLKDRFLRKLCCGEWVGANAITEQEAGSDIFALKARAERDGDDYVLNGVKSYVSNGPIADLFVTYASTKPSHGYLGISAFLVEKDTPGLRLGEKFNKMGLSTTPACMVTFENCRVPVSNRVGTEGQGATIFRRSMHWERSCLFAGYLGMLERQLEQCVAHARTRRQFGRTIGKNQAIAHRIADMKMRLETARLLLYRACWQLDQGADGAMDISLAKLAISEAAIQSSIDAIQIHGGAGFAVEQGIERMLRDSIPTTIFSGTSEMQRDIIAKECGL